MLVIAAVVIAPILFSLRGSALGPGSVLEVPLTLITADKHDLSCAFEAEVAGHRCAFLRPFAPAPVESTKPLLQPFVALDRQMFLIPGLFAEPNLARRYAAELPQGVPRERLRRFTARCRLELLKGIAGAFVRFGPGAAWGAAPPLYVAKVLSCRVEG
jgi:hypothetical protein